MLWLKSTEDLRYYFTHDEINSICTVPTVPVPKKCHFVHNHTGTGSYQKFQMISQ